MSVDIVAAAVSFYGNPVALTAGGTDRLALVLSAINSTNAPDQTATYDGNSMTQRFSARDILFAWSVRAWSYAPSVAGAANCAITSAENIRGTATCAVTGFDATTPVRTTGSGTGSGTAISLTVATEVGDTVVAMVTQFGGGTFTAHSGTTLVAQDPTDGTVALLSKVAVGASTTIEVDSASGSYDWTISALVIAPASSYSPPILPFLNILLVP